MKVGIITFHCSYNFGSVLQAYALQTAVERLGHEATIIDYRSRDFRQYSLLRIRRPKNMIHDILWLDKNIRRRNEFRKFWDNYLHLTPVVYSYKNESRLVELNDDFDCFICGSDQIWNLDCTNGFIGPYFLTFSRNTTCIAYGPSLAHNLIRIKDDDLTAIKLALKGFQDISVRERETIPLVSQWAERPVKNVLDPTMILEQDQYHFLLKEADNIEEEYFFIYMLKYSKEIVAAANAFQHETGLKIKYVYDNNLSLLLSENCYGIGPIDFLNLIYHAKYVLTNSFHATAFSVLFQRDFLSFNNTPSGMRMHSFLDSLDLTDCCTSSIPSTFPSGIDYSLVDSRLRRLRNNSLTFLQKGLDCNGRD